MRGQLIAIGAYDNQFYLTAIDGTTLHAVAATVVHFTLSTKRQRALATGHRKVDVGEDLGIEQGTVLVAPTVIDIVATT